MEDLLTYGEGLEVAQRDLLVSEVGKAPQSLPDQVIAVVRDEKVYRYFDPTVTLLARGDELIVVRPAKELPWAPRPGTHDEDASDDELVSIDVTRFTPPRRLTCVKSAAKRVVVEGLGWILVLVGIAALVLPGPGLLALFAGVALLATQYEWAERRVEPVKKAALRGAADSVKTWPRILVSAAGCSG